MKKLNVTIQLEMTVPDDWELVDTSEGTPVIRSQAVWLCHPARFPCGFGSLR